MDDFQKFLINLECESPKAPKNAILNPDQNQRTQREKSKKHRTRGGYRPILVEEANLKNESIMLENQMSVLNCENQMSDQDKAAFYILVYLNHRYPNNLFQSFNKIEESSITNSIDFNRVLKFSNKNVATRLKKFNINNLFELVNSFNLHSVPHSARFTLVKWYTNPDYNLKLFVNEIPTSNQVLEMQANKQRCVSLIFNKIDELIMNERDPLSFLLHDLVHAYKMFHNKCLLQSQVGFYRSILKLNQNANFKIWLDNLKSNNKEFAENFDYLISDMNSHAKHLFFYLKTILINAIKAEFKIDSSREIDGMAFDEFNRIFENIMELFEMSESEKISSRSMLTNLDDDNSFKSFNFILLNDFFNKIGDS